MNKTTKNFSDWIELKERLDRSSGKPLINEGDIWWAAIGENVGIEICGKGKKFSRPVVILRQLGPLGFMCIPLTSREHSGTWYVPFEFKGKKEYAVLSQARILSVARLFDKYGSLTTSDFRLIKTGFKNLYCADD